MMVSAENWGFESVCPHIQPLLISDSSEKWFSEWLDPIDSTDNLLIIYYPLIIPFFKIII